MNTRGSKTASTCNRFCRPLWLQLHMLYFLDITSLLGSSTAQNWTSVGTYPTKNMAPNERAERWEIEKQAKISCLRLRFTSHMLLFILSDQMKMVLYFKTSQSIRFIVPLNGHFKSELWWILQNQRHKMYHMCVPLFRGKRRTLISPVSGHFTIQIWHEMFVAVCISHLVKKVAFSLELTNSLFLS